VYSDDSVALDLLRALCERQGVKPADEDLRAVQGFLRLLLPALEKLEELVPDDVASVP
jgi:hypothetical protein